MRLAERKPMEARDELWLSHIGLEYLPDMMKDHEREWLDSLPAVQHSNVFSLKNNMDNVGYITTTKSLVQARDWQ